MIDPKNIPILEVLEGALEYMKETETAARRSCGYPMDLERCIRFQIDAIGGAAKVEPTGVVSTTCETLLDS